MHATCIIRFLSVYCAVHLDKESDSNKIQKEEHNSVALTFLLHVAHEGRERESERGRGECNDKRSLPSCMHAPPCSQQHPSQRD